MKKLFQRLPNFLVCFGLIFGAVGVHADYPDRVVRMVVGYSAGGNTDFIARLVAGRLAEKWGQPVIVENRPGADAMIAEEFVALSKPDGYTLAVIDSSHTISPLLKKLSFDPIEALAPISLLEAHGTILVISPTLPVKDLKAFIALAKSKPNQLTFGHTGSGTPPFLTMAQLMKKTGTTMLGVPYGGTAPAAVAVLVGEVQSTWGSVGSLSGFINSGKVRPLAFSSKERSAVFTTVPTVAETLGLDFDERVWLGIAAPTGTSKEVINIIRSAVVEVLRQPNLKSVFTQRDFTAIGSSPEEFDRFIRADKAKLAEVLKGIKPQ